MNDGLSNQDIGYLIRLFERLVKALELMAGNQGE